jgi:hypothetical protein
MSLPLHFQNLLTKLSKTAEKSIICHQHGAVLLKNGTPILWGYNNIVGNVTLHAECSVIRQFLRLKGIKDIKGIKHKEEDSGQYILWN